MKMKKIFLISLSLLFLVVIVNKYKENLALGLNLKKDLAPGAQAAVLINAKTKKVLFSKNKDQRRLIASTTKIMTAIVAIEDGKLDDIVTIGPNAVGVEGSSVYLKLGDKIPLKSLLYGLMLRSGNDAAVAIAEYIGGSIDGFVFLMNQKAEQLGLKNTHFANPTGLHDFKNYSSAYDLAILTAYCLKNPVFAEIVRTKQITVPWTEGTTRSFANKNKLLHMYKWADGVKTGYTKKSGRTLVASATMDGIKLVAVTLSDPTDWKDMIRMFEYGFKKLDKNYKGIALTDKDKIVAKKKEEVLDTDFTTIFKSIIGQN